MKYFPSPVWLTLTYEIGVGIACGFTYATIAPTARKCFVDRAGFAVSLAVMGFGLAVVIFAPLKKEMIKLLVKWSYSWHQLSQYYLFHFILWLMVWDDRLWDGWLIARVQ